MSYNYQDASMESQQEYFGKVHTDNKETLQNALKRIEELEQKLEQTEKDLTDYQFNYPKIKDLEKENTALKEELKDANEKVVHLACNQDKDLVRKLTKAKDLLLRVIDLKNKPCAVGHSVNMLLYENICKEAEQFLKDCDIDNAIQQANKGLDFDKIADEMEQDLKDSEVEK